MREPIIPTATDSSRQIAAVSGQALAAERAADQRGYQEEGADRQLQERRQGAAPTGQPILVNTHDFIDEELGKAIPYGIYDVGRDEGWVTVGISADTAQFAVAAIKAWWKNLGKKRYPNAKTLTITADCGGSNSYRTRLWKTELQRLADQTGLRIRVMHYPPGTSKWNKIEHRLFSYISINWRAKPLVSRQTVIDLIASTTTSTGLKVYARLDPEHLPHQDQSHRPANARRPTRRATSSTPSGTTPSLHATN